MPIFDQLDNDQQEWQHRQHAVSRARIREGFEDSRENSLKAVGASPGIDHQSLTSQSNNWMDSRQEQNTAKFFREFRQWVYVCVNAIAKRVASQAVMAGEVVGATENPDRHGKPTSKHPGGKASGLRGSMEEAFAAKMMRNYTDVENLDDHKILDIMAQPNEVQGQFEFFYFSVANLLISGQCYWVGGEIDDPSQADGKRMDIWALPSHWIKPKHKDGLFSGYVMKVPGSTGEGMPLEPNQVCRTYIPNPENPLTCYSPVEAAYNAIRTDNFIQGTQLDSFQKGIFPNVVLTVGKVRGEDGKALDTRPVLSPAQRRQVINAVRNVWQSVQSVGDPAIIDGLIESVHKLQSTPAEMDWSNSGAIVKSRIFQTFSVNPIVVGEIVASNRAQAVEADKNFCQMATNPVISQLSTSLTNWLGPMFEKPDRLLIWLEKCEPRDTDQEFTQLMEARKNGDVYRNEVRTFLGLLPVEDDEEDTISPILTDTNGLSAVMGVIQAANRGEISRDAAIATLTVFLRLSPEIVSMMVGQIIDFPPALPPGGADDDDPEDDPEDEENLEGDPEDDEDIDADFRVEPGDGDSDGKSAMKMGTLVLNGKRVPIPVAMKSVVKLLQKPVTRKSIAEHNVKRLTQAEKEVGAALRRFFLR